MRLNNSLPDWLQTGRVETNPATLTRGRVDHVIIIDGSMSSLRDGFETNAGILYKLLCEVAPSRRLSLRYEAGIQWHRWHSFRDVLEGRGINRQIRRAYGFLASRYRPGDRIFLFGYSRGAYAVRSLAGVIDRVGLLRAEHATVRNIRQVYRHYQEGGDSKPATEFQVLKCHPKTVIELVGVWDTVRALGLRVPLLWRWSPEPQQFHNHDLGHHIAHGFQALALDETRNAYAPVLWECREGWQGRLEQVWFRGSHGDVGGQLKGVNAARPLSNIPLVWMLDRAAMCDLPLPVDWRARFAQDVNAPSVGTTRGWAKLFLSRSRRIPLSDPSESYHITVQPPDPMRAAAVD